ncbi:MAG: hypothetical protein QHH09_03015 [Microgenomates group bacterium]|nr:hypothetical protein [Microgenomates group bacterium]
MKKNQLLNKLFSDKSRDYSYFSLFFIIFTIFVIFAIKPSLSTAFSLKKEAEDLQKVNSYYEKIIGGIVQAQALLEINRDRLYLLNEAIPDMPQVNKIAGDIRIIAEQNNLQIDKLNIDEIELTKNKKENVLRTVRVNLEASAYFDNLLAFVKNLLQQRRLKSINKLIINKEKEVISTESAQLKINFELEGYYL